MNYIEGNLETKYGAIRFACTDDDHVSITSGPLNVGPTFTVRGVEYHVHIHLFRKVPEWDVRDYHDFYVSRANQKPVSEAARKTIKTELIEVWSKYIKEHPENLRQAHINALCSQEAQLSDKIIEAETVLGKLKQQFQDIQAAIKVA
jgi:hypothetical protein